MPCHTIHAMLYFFLQEMLINTRTRQFHSFIYHQEHLYNRTLTTSYFRPGNIAKFIRTAFLRNTSGG